MLKLNSIPVENTCIGVLTVLGSKLFDRRESLLTSAAAKNVYKIMIQSILQYSFTKDPKNNRLFYLRDVYYVQIQYE